MSTERTAKVGDVVRLKAASWPMTIIAISAQARYATCFWLGEQGEPYQAELPILGLALSDDIAPPLQGFSVR